MDNLNKTENKFPMAENTNDGLSCFHLILFSGADEMYSLWLPVVPEGFFRFTDSHEHRFLSITAKNGQWVAICKKPAFFMNVPLSNSCEIPLQNGQLLNIDFEDNLYTMYVEKVSRQQMIYRNYAVCSNAEIGIGSQPGNDICFDSPYVSRNHAVLTRVNGQWSIRDCGSTHGVYVNRKKRDFANLDIGDTIFIMGLRIIVGPSFFSINDGIGAVKINHGTLQKQTSNISGYSRYFGQDIEEPTEHFFNRAPRKRTDMEPRIITVEGPPMSINQNKIPLMLRMGSSLVMGGNAAMSGNFTTLLTSVLFPFITSKYTDKQRQEYEELRTEKYTEYLEQKTQEIDDACVEEQEILNKRYPLIRSVIDIAFQKTHLWERRPIDTDFLQLRLGTGTLPLSARIEYPPKRFELEPDELEEQMYALVEAPHYVENVPIVLSLTETIFCGLSGKRQLVIDFIRQMILQIAVLHSYDEVKMVFLLNKKELAQLDPIRYLPHTWDDQRSIRFVATDEAEAYRLGEYIQERIQDEREDSERPEDLQRVMRKHPYYVVFALDKKLIESHEVLKTIQASANNKGVSVITAYDDLPKESQKIITLESVQNNTCTTMSVNGGDDIHFRLDPANNTEISDAMHTLANISLRTMAQAHTMPKMVTFLEMFKTGRIEQLNPLKRWRDNNPVKSLAAPVGVAADETLFMLDLHEKHQGPHGLVAGMTGSGKSEFIITYILSMAVNYHPDEVAFVLIDYKGGGLADAFDNPRTGVRLPHLAGTITNLDGAAIQRSLMSIESELVRRQKVFSDVGKSFDEGSMNIYTYQKLYRSGKVSEPMPHLFIISDEFAELKQQQPEFMEKLISAARIGRSLGVHLILATQKPSGVVNDQIRSNTKFRVCLRVQDRNDSMDMLKRPEAAELKDTGRFYLQVGYNEYFAVGQSAWCGAQYEPQDTAPVQRDDAIEFMDTTGQVITRAKPQVKKTDSGMKQIGAVVQYLSDLAKRENISTRQLWIEPLPKTLDLNSLREEYADQNSDCVSTIIGLVDDPEHQCQFPLTLEIEKQKNMLLSGNAGCGKTTLLKSILYSLTRNYTPDKVNYYIIDFSGGTLGVFRKAPHCGAFITESDESDLDRFLAMLKQMIQDRKKLFGQAGVTSYDAYKQIDPIPLIVVVVDGASGFTGLKKGNHYFSTFHEYLKEAPGLGIQFIVSCSNSNELSTRSKQELLDRLALHLKDRFVYNDMLNCRGVVVPPELKGRGICVKNGKMLEYQTAIPFDGQSEQQRTASILEEVQQIAIRDKEHPSAQKLPVVSDEETYEEFCSDIAPGRIPLGYELKNVAKISIPFAQLYCTSVYFGNPHGIAPVLNNFVFASVKNKMKLVVVRRSVNSAFDNKDIAALSHPNIQVFDSFGESTSKLCELLIQEVKQRKAVRNEYCEQNGIPIDMAKTPAIIKKAGSYIRQRTEPMMILIEDFYEFSTNLQSSAFNVYKEIFENGKGYNFYFISCFYPEFRDKLSVDLLAKSYNTSAFMLFFGGQFQNQTLTSLPMEYRQITAPSKKYNSFLMRYKETIYPLVMPCGLLIEAETDPDEKPII